MNQFFKKIHKMAGTKNPANREVLSGTNKVRNFGLPSVDFNYTFFMSSINNNTDKKAPTETTTLAMDSVGAARSAIPDCHLMYSLSYTLLMSNEDINNQKPRFGRACGSVEDRGFAPLDSLVATRGRHYASLTVKLL